MGEFLLGMAQLFAEPYVWAIVFGLFLSFSILSLPDKLDGIMHLMRENNEILKRIESKSDNPADKSP